MIEATAGTGTDTSRRQRVDRSGTPLDWGPVSEGEYSYRGTVSNLDAYASASAEELLKRVPVGLGPMRESYISDAM